MLVLVDVSYTFKKKRKKKYRLGRVNVLLVVLYKNCCEKENKLV